MCTENNFAQKELKTKSSAVVCHQKWLKKKVSKVVQDFWSVEWEARMEYNW